MVLKARIRISLDTLTLIYGISFITFPFEGETLRVSHTKQIEEQERSYISKGIAKRSFDLAWKIASKFDLNKLEATLDKGLLILDIPISVEKAPKKIEIKSKLLK